MLDHVRNVHTFIPTSSVCSNDQPERHDKFPHKSKATPEQSTETQ